MVKGQFYLLTLCQAQREAGRGYRRELCLFKHVFIKQWGDVLNTVWNGLTVLTRTRRSEAAVLAAAAAAAGLLGVTVTQALPKASLNATKAL